MAKRFAPAQRKFLTISTRSFTRISIIIPALNEAEGIARAVERACAIGPEEIIVVDGGSDDETANIAAQARCRLIRGPRGRAVQQNLGASAALGDVLLFLHSDTWLAPQGLQQIRSAMSNPRVLAGAFEQHIEAGGAAYRLLERGNGLRVRVLGLPYGDQGIFVRRSLFERMGGFPPVPVMEDLLFMKRVRRLTSLVLLPGPLHVRARRWQKYGVARQTLRNWSLLAALELGVSPARLAKRYPAHS